MNRKTLAPDAVPPQQTQPTTQTIESLLFDPVFKTNDFAVVIVAQFVPEYGHGIYGVVNRNTAVIEGTRGQYVGAEQLAIDLQDRYNHKDVLPNAPETPEVSE